MRRGFANISQPDQADLRQCWRTDAGVFARLHRIFGFTVDACADGDNALLPRYWDERIDGFAQDWSDERVWCNPPFRLGFKAVEKAQTASLAVVLLPHTCVVNKYFARNRPAHLLLPAGRLKFTPPPGLLRTSSGPLGTVLLLYGATPEQLSELGWLGSVYDLRAKAG